MATKERFLTGAGLILIGLGSLFISQFSNYGRLRLIFCDVGQGDAILLIAPSGKQVLVDSGPGSKVLECLSDKMPFWDRKLEMILLTHPQKDHMEGFIEVLARYQVDLVATTGVKSDSEVFSAFAKAVNSEGARMLEPAAGQEIVIDGGSNKVFLQVLWPVKSELALWQDKSPSDLNETSVVLRLNYGQFCAYLTGDIPKEILGILNLGECELLKVSHHGSRTGTDDEILEKIKPKVAVIQVGKNSYGHPHKEVVDLLSSRGVKIFRNDISHIIQISSNGRSFVVKGEKQN